MKKGEKQKKVRLPKRSTPFFMTVSLLKYSKSGHIIDMFNKEYLYFSKFSKFRNRKLDNSGRPDPREGNLSNKQIEYLELDVNGKKIILSEILRDFSAQVQKHPQILPGNICSFYSIQYDETNPEVIIDKRVLKLGDKALLIYKLKEFFEILDASLKKLKYGFTRKSVIYYDPSTYNGDLTYHHKDKAFSYQKEYRVYLNTPGTEPLKIEIPGLKKVSEVFESDKTRVIKIKRNLKTADNKPV